MLINKINNSMKQCTVALLLARVCYRKISLLHNLLFKKIIFSLPSIYMFSSQELNTPNEILMFRKFDLLSIRSEREGENTS